MAIRKNEIFLFVLIIFCINLSQDQIMALSMRSHALNKDADNFLTFPLTAKILPYRNLSFLSITNDLKQLSESVQTHQMLTKTTTEYTGKVQIGNPGQELEMVFDTGSANILVISSKCVSDGCWNHKKYHSPSSTTSKEIISLAQHSEDYIKNPEGGRDIVSIHFGTGKVTSYITQDDICIGDKKLCAEQMLLIEAYYVTPIPFSKVSFDGIIGLSFSHLSLNPNANFLDMLYAQKKINKRIFSFYFNKDDKQESQLHIGGINLQSIDGAIFFSQVISRNYWEIKLDGIYYGESKIITCDNGNTCTAIIDSGTSMIAAPFAAYNSILSFSKIESDCSNYNFLLNLQFEINGQKFTLEPEYYVMKIPERNLEDRVTCFNMLMELNALSSTNKLTFILGVPFFKKYYTIFDREKNRVGFGVAKHSK